MLKIRRELSEQNEGNFSERYRVGLFYYNKRIYLQFYKLQEGSATSIFTGLYWFSNEIRKKNNVLIPIEPELNSVAKELMKNRGN